MITLIKIKIFFFFFPGDVLAGLKLASLQAQGDDAQSSLSSRHSGINFWLLK